MTGYSLRRCNILLVLVLSLFLQACSGSQPNSSSSTSTTSAPPAYEGFVDDINCTSVVAWGWDMTRPNDPVKLDFYDGNVLIGTANAEHFRQDLLNSGKGNGKHYLIWLIPVQLKDAKPHKIMVKFGGTSLEAPFATKAPKEITCTLEK